MENMHTDVRVLRIKVKVYRSFMYSSIDDNVLFHFFPALQDNMDLLPANTE